jgi:hypothetical protein
MTIRIERAAGLLAIALWAVLAMTQSPCERADGTVAEVCDGR